MYPLSKCSGHRNSENRDGNSYVNSCVNSYVNSLVKAEITASLYHTEASIYHIERLSKSEIPIYNPEVLDTADRKTKRSAQVIAKRYAFYANAVIENLYLKYRG